MHPCIVLIEFNRHFVHKFVDLRVIRILQIVFQFVIIYYLLVLMMAKSLYKFLLTAPLAIQIPLGMFEILIDASPT